jgi:hypothetical protein
MGGGSIAQTQERDIKRLSYRVFQTMGLTPLFDLVKFKWTVS